MKYVITQGDKYTEERGLFSFVLQYLSNCRYYHSLNENFCINFDLKNKTSYYDKNNLTTNNVWEYYFIPEFNLDVVHDNTIFVEWVGEFNFYGYDFDFNNINEKTHIKNIINVNLKFNNNILNKVDVFYEKYKDKKILGVHVRGTDIIIHHNKFNLSRYVDIINNELINGYDFIFICSDEHNVISELKEIYGDKLINYHTETLSNNPNLPLFKQEVDNRYQMGEDVIIESLILSKTSHLIKSKSNVSNFSLLYNPDLQFTEIR